ncbi:MAG: hypothetical protein VR64_02735 [Desulfatitalea sp. BRH_c12]|nr:MAG: hypothetical protein VR64_02735 [Desulfatitalea sp. BRH_c12]
MPVEKKYSWFVCGIFLAAAIIICTIYFSRDTYPPTDKMLQVRYSLTIQNTNNIPIENVSLQVQRPLEQTAFQKCRNVNANYKFQEIGKGIDNRFLLFKWDLFPPFTSRIINIQSDLDICFKANKTVAPDIENYLRTVPLIESDHPEIKGVANQLRGDTDYETARKIYDWVGQKLIYIGYIKQNRGALYALRHAKGDCTEFACLFAALCRANGVPARVIGGFVCPNNAVLDLSDYHNWAEFFADGRWHLADPQRRQFMTAADTYIAFDNGHALGSGSFAVVSGAVENGLKIRLSK